MMQTGVPVDYRDLPIEIGCIFLYNYCQFWMIWLFPSRSIEA